MFSQADIDKRGIRIWRDGQLAELTDFRENDKLTATIVTTMPPKVMTQKQVDATLAKSGGAPSSGVSNGGPGTLGGGTLDGGGRCLPRRSTCPRRQLACRFLGSPASPHCLRR